MAAIEATSDRTRSTSSPSVSRRTHDEAKPSFLTTEFYGSTRHQTATMAGAQSTQAAAHAGTWSTMIAGSAGLVVGLFLALAFAATTRS